MNSTGRLIAALAVVFAIAGSGIELKAQTEGLFSGVTGGSSVAAFAIGATGPISAIAGSPFATSANVNGVAVDPTGQYLYATTASNGLLPVAHGEPGAAVRIPVGPIRNPVTL